MLAAGRRTPGVACWLAVLFLVLSCDDGPNVKTFDVADTDGTQTKRTSSMPSATATPSANAETTASRPSTAPDEPAAPEPEEATSPEGAVTRDFIIDGLADVGPAGPATASEHGIVMVTRLDEVQVAVMGSRSREAKPVPTPVTPLPDEAGPFPLARGPAVLRGYAYWASKGALLRRKLLPRGKAGDIEVLARDARPGARVAAPTGPKKLVDKLPEVVAYLADPQKKDGPLTARLWTASGHSPTLTPEGASALSVALMARRGGVLALGFEGRTGMSTLHARNVTLSGSKKPVLGVDAVVWVGGSAQPLTEVVVGGDLASPTAYLAMERDITRFGLLTLQLRDLGEAVAEWYEYENGIDPAPLAAGRLCGRRVLLRAQPSRSLPGSPQLLLLSEEGKPEPALAVLARSKAFFNASITEVPGGALLTYVADRRTWARTLRCIPGSK